MALTEDGKKLIEMGSAIAGGVTGTALTFFTEEPEAQLAAAGIGAHLPLVINDFASRFLSEREKVKIGATEAFTIHKILKNIESKKPVNKHFVSQPGRKGAIELHEGVLIKAKNEFEEKKIELIANVLGNSLFNDKVKPEDANHILQLVSNLSYRKLCILAYYGRRQAFPNLHLIASPFLHFPEIQFSLDTEIVSQDVFELREQGILDAGKGNALLAGDKQHLTPNEMSLSKIGQLYFEVIDLGEIEQTDILSAIQHLEYRPEYGKALYT